MPPAPRLNRPLRRAVLLAAALPVLALAWVLHPGAGRATPPSADEAVKAHACAAMSDAEMEAWVNDWFANHPRVGIPAAATETPAATFTASGTQFDADGNSATVVDTVVIGAGQTVEWRRVSGFHTVTSGTGSDDPDAGALFDQSLTSTAVPFFYTFTAPGTYPFFCRPHEFFDMKGVVVVLGPTPVRSTTWGGLKLLAR